MMFDCSESFWADFKSGRDDYVFTWSLDKVGPRPNPAPTPNPDPDPNTDPDPDPDLDPDLKPNPIADLTLTLTQP